jgi:hypothetical protein
MAVETLNLRIQCKPKALFKPVLFFFYVCRLPIPTWLIGALVKIRIGA